MKIKDRSKLLYFHSYARSRAKQLLFEDNSKSADFVAQLLKALHDEHKVFSVKNHEIGLVLSNVAIVATYIFELF